MGAVTSANIKPHLNALYVQLVRGSDAPTAHFADNNYWVAFLESMQAIQQVTNEKEADAGFPTLRYMGKKAFLDGGYGGGCPTNHWYMVSGDYLFFRPHSSRNFVPLGGKRQSVNQDASVNLLGFAGAMTMSVGFLHGVLKA